MNKNSAYILQVNKVQIITLITGCIQLAEGNSLRQLYTFYSSRNEKVGESDIG
jgi:hypothetical protein